MTKEGSHGSVVRRFFGEGGDAFVDAPGWDCEHYPNGMGNDRPEEPPKIDHENGPIS